MPISHDYEAGRDYYYDSSDDDDDDDDDEHTHPYDLDDDEGDFDDMGDGDWYVEPLTPAQEIVHRLKHWATMLLNKVKYAGRSDPWDEIPF